MKRAAGLLAADRSVSPAGDAGPPGGLEPNLTSSRDGAIVARNARRLSR
jgi:hypothetical protein